MVEIGSTVALAASNGRPIKFTPERFEQIRNLVERGKSREEIAALIGCTVGSLQVTCSRAGISLRRLRLNSGVELKPPRLSKPVTREPIMEINGNAEPTIKVAIIIRHRDIVKKIDVPVTPEIFSQLLFKAEVTGVSLGELVAKALEEQAFA